VKREYHCKHLQNTNKYVHVLYIPSNMFYGGGKFYPDQMESFTTKKFHRENISFIGVLFVFYSWREKFPNFPRIYFTWLFSSRKFYPEGI